MRAGFNLNSPLKLHHHPDPKSVEGLLSSFKIANAPGLVLDVVKRGEDDEDVAQGLLPAREGKSIVVRIYDSLGGRTTGMLQWGDIPVKKVWKSNILEDELESCSFHSKDKGIEIELRAFEVATYKLQL